MLLLLLGSSMESGFSQTLADSLDVIAEIFKFSEVERGLEMHGNHPNALVIICSASSHNRNSCPGKFTFGGLDIYFCRRVDLTGSDINYWMALNSLRITPSSTIISFSMITTKNVWLEEFDEIDFGCEAVFTRLDSKWVIQSKRIL